MRYFAALVLLAILAGLAVHYLGENPASVSSSPSQQTSSTTIPSERRVTTVADDADKIALLQRLGGNRSTDSGAERVQGVVLDPRGTALAGATVVLLRLRSPWPEQRSEEVARVLTGNGGEFRFAAARDVDLALEVIAPGVARERFAAPAALNNITVRTSFGFDVQGVVRLAAQPVGKELVRVVLEPGAGGVRRAISTQPDENGRFRFEHVAAGPARVTAHFLHFLPSTVNTVSVGGDPISVTLMTTLGTTLSGRVRSFDDQPVADAEVKVYPSTAWNLLLYEPLIATTDAQGEFHVTGLGNSAVMVKISHPDHSSVSRPVSLASGSSSQDFELPRRARLALRLTGVTRPLMQFRIVTDSGAIHRAKLGESNRVEFPESMTAGSAKLEILDGACAFSESGSRETDLDLREGVLNEFDFELIEPARIRGRVVDDQGAPLADVLVDAPRARFDRRNPESWSTATDSDGRFELRGLASMSTVLRFSLDGWTAEDLPIEVGAEQPTVDLGEVRMGRPGMVTGTVIRDGAPLGGVNLFATRGGETGSLGVSGPDGRYVLHGLTPGRYRVMARFGSMPIQIHDAQVNVEAGRTTEAIDIDVPVGRRVRGRVMTRAGAPVADALVFVVGANTAVTATDQNGNFEMEVPEGPLDIQAFSPDFLVNETEPLSENGSQINIRLPWFDQGVVEGSIATAVRGAQPQRVLLSLRPLDEGLSSEDRALRTRVTTVDVEPGGAIHVEQIPAGRAELRVIAPGFGAWSQSVDVTPAARGVTTLPKVLLETGASIAGVVVDGEGKPIVGAAVHLGEVEDLSSPLAYVNQTDRDGRFSISGVTPRSHRLVVAAEGYMTQSREIVLPDDLLRVDPLVIKMGPNSRIRVQLTRNGQPVSELRMVSIRRDEVFLFARMSDVDGAIAFVADRPGTYRIGLFGEPDHEGARVEVGADSKPAAVELPID
ncbi:MAG: carboxypeptidase regulatory-like domain-containing protein [Planctomycetota bacterium]